MNNLYLLLLTIAFATMAGCRPDIDRVKAGSYVCFNYAIKKNNGTRIDNNRCHRTCAKDNPAKFCVIAGMGWLVPAWDTALLSMKAGETKTVLIPPEKGWGTAHPPQGLLPTDTLILTIESIELSDLPLNTE